MSVLPVGFGSSGGYEISNSLRLRASASAYFNRTFGTPTANTTWTLSLFLKRGLLTGQHALLSAGDSQFYFRDASNQALLFLKDGGIVTTSASLFRDPSAHGHLCFISNGTTVKAYWNSVEIMSYTGTIPDINSAVAHNIGRYPSGSDYFDGYLSDIYFIDGQALTPSSFGETNADSVWVPKAYSGTYGTNGFHLDFKDANLTAGSNVGLGKDVSGNGNYWTTNNISVTAGVTYDSMVDTPTNNYATLNPLDQGATGTLSNGNMKFVGSASYSSVHRSTIAIPAGSTAKIYWEVNCENEPGGSHYHGMGVWPATAFSTSGGIEGVTNAYGYQWTSLRYRVSSGTATSEGATDLVAGDTMCFAWDVAAGKLWARRGAGSWYNGSGDPATGTNPSISGVPTNIDMVIVDVAYDRTHHVNLGQQPNVHTPPTGFKALCTANLPAVTITNPVSHFDAKTRTGTGASFNVTGIGFSPDLVWSKGRSGATDHAIYDAVRGVQKQLESNTNSAESTEATGLTAFNADGFTGGALAQINTNAATYVDWLWKANGAGSSNTAGSITSTVSANATAGFSIVTWTGTGSNATVGHGLGVAPKLIFNKPRNAADNWPTYHGSMTALDYVYLNNTNASASLAAMWNSTAPSSTVFSVGTNANINSAAQTMVSYCFAEIPGYSKFGSYTANSSADGPFVYCGFRPRWILLKATGTTGGYWELIDTARDTYNQTAKGLYPNGADAEGSDGLVDITANGFKIRSGAYSYNDSAKTQIFAAFAEHPFGGSNVAPSPAR